MENYGLDPARFFTKTGLSWDAGLKMTGVKLELFIDPDMENFIDNAIRSGVAMRIIIPPNRQYIYYMLMPITCTVLQVPWLSKPI